MDKNEPLISFVEKKLYTGYGKEKQYAKKHMQKASIINMQFY